MNVDSLFPHYVAGVENLDEEHDRVVALIERLGKDIGCDDFERAIGSADLLQVDLEAYFAFEELVMERTGFPAASAHCAHHSAQLSALLEFLSDLRTVATGSIRKEDRERLLGTLARIRNQLEAHIAGPDLVLRQHVGGNR